MSAAGSSSGRSAALSARGLGALLGLFALVAVAIWLLNRPDGAVTPAATTATTATSATTVTTATSATSVSTRTPPSSSAPARTKALYVLAVVDATGDAPSGYVGGRQFMNDERGGTTALPRRDGGGRAVTYHEYDVNPRRPGVNRGPQRLVVGSDGSAYLTADHYVTWERLR